MRLFVAAVLPPEVIDHLAATVDPLRDRSLRWSNTDAWHITLAFYGEVAESKLDDVTGRIARGARRYPPVDAQLAGAGRFGSAVLWIGVHGELATLHRIARSMAGIGRRIGAGQERRRFRPHVTIARSKGLVDLRFHVERLASYAGPSWTVGEVALIRSHLGTGQPTYEVVRRFVLSASEKRGHGHDDDHRD